MRDAPLTFPPRTQCSCVPGNTPSLTMAATLEIDPALYLIGGGAVMLVIGFVVLRNRAERNQAEEAYQNAIRQFLDIKEQLELIEEEMEDKQQAGKLVRRKEWRQIDQAIEALKELEANIELLKPEYVLAERAEARSRRQAAVTATLFGFYEEYRLDCMADDLHKLRRRFSP
jgi:hypothetical protein